MALPPQPQVVVTPATPNTPLVTGVVTTPVVTGVGTAPAAADDVAALKASLLAATTRADGLQAQLDAIALPPRMPDDLAAGLAQALDKLQTALGDVTNPDTRFAVRDFRLDTNVHVDLTALGTVTFRFVGYNETVDPNSLSKLSIQVAPIPRDSKAAPASSQPLDSLGLSTDQLALLHQNGLDTVGDFLAVGTRARATVELAAMLKVDRVALTGLVGKAQLLTVPGITPGHVTALSTLGITTVAALAEADPQALATKAAAGGQGAVLDLSTAKTLVAAAKG